MRIRYRVNGVFEVNTRIWKKNCMNFKREETFYGAERARTSEKQYYFSLVLMAVFTKPPQQMKTVNENVQTLVL
jgi:hypothetical protein